MNTFFYHAVDIIMNAIKFILYELDMYLFIFIFIEGATWGRERPPELHSKVKASLDRGGPLQPCLGGRSVYNIWGRDFSLGPNYTGKLEHQVLVA